MMDTYTSRTKQLAQKQASGKSTPYYTVDAQPEAMQPKKRKKLLKVAPKAP